MTTYTCVLIVGNGCPLSPASGGPSYATPRRHPLSLHPPDSRPRRRHGRRCDRAWRLRLLPPLPAQGTPALDPSAAAAARARSPAWPPAPPPTCPASAWPPDRRRRARPARRPAEAPSSPRPLGHRVAGRRAHSRQEPRPRRPDHPPARNLDLFTDRGSSAGSVKRWGEAGSGGQERWSNKG